MKKKSLNYQLGRYVGEYILSNYLPTLSTDMLLSMNVIKLSEDDEQKCNELHKLLTDSYTFSSSKISDETELLHKNWITHQNKMAIKYLPHILKCYIPKITPTNMKKFKKGIIDTLWNCDLCWYDLNQKSIEYITGYKYAWCDEINLKLNTEILGKSK